MMTRPESDPRRARPRQRARVPLRKLLRVASMASGIQFGWALQLSLLTPYVQQLGIPHAWASAVWLCGPLSGLLVQPLVGHLSDRCTSRFGRRRPFISAGAASIVAAVVIIGYSADVGWLLGDREGSRKGAIGAFVVGFWLLDVANNVTQGPCRALLADLTGKPLPFGLKDLVRNSKKWREPRFYLMFEYKIGEKQYERVMKENEKSLTKLTKNGKVHRRNRVANAYFSLFMAVGNVLGFASSAAVDEPTPNDISEQSSHACDTFLWDLFGTLRYLSGPIWIILLVTALTWIGWFPFLLFDTDWMGREIYGGKPNEGQNYSKGVRTGAFGLDVEFSGSWCDFGSPGEAVPEVGDWCCMGDFEHPHITYSVPYALISSHIESLGLGQGLSMGVLNLAIVIPQMLVSLGSGPLDQLFGGGNSPALAVAAVAAFTSGLIAILSIPRTGAKKSRIRK
ncbi:sucrose transporter 4 [Actinidia rufa]|uniref:Sucrose transporter 4 n=1 Tax=Actinidia rufa TaxID=165716 RepID=A0A7J0DY89_9ERIC|nr:sucrose transporter 4 [Actinidia rufa]